MSFTRLQIIRLSLVLCLILSVSAFQKSAFIDSSNSKILTASGSREYAITTSFFRLNSPTSSRLVASGIGHSSSSLSAFKFKNIEEMLHAFRDEPVVVYFTSVTCGPCKLQKKELAQVRDIVGAEAAFKVISIDTKKWPHVGSRFSIGKLPCLLVMKDKEVIIRLEGFTKAEEVVEKVYSNALFERLL